MSFKILTINSDVLALVAPQGGATGRPSGNAATAKFGIAFNSADYIIIPVGVIDADDTKWGLTVNVLKDYKTATNCTFRTSDSIAPACYYFAIGL
ncbi:hypothetical protein [Veillonella sp.]|uniref:hypothetical protein n=1 Tax=Veillonella sp. TaxID=1926307 RepID=UPI0025D45158|nr:hypothetical protein [Veillonella sp.]